MKKQYLILGMIVAALILAVAMTVLAFAMQSQSASVSSQAWSDYMLSTNYQLAVLISGTLEDGTAVVVGGIPMAEGGLTELVGINEEVNTSDYSGSIGVALGGTYSGEILNVALYATEDGSGAVQDSAGQLLILDADPSVASGDTALAAAEFPTVLAKVVVEAADWHTDSAGGVAYIVDTPVSFHALSTLYFVWFHEDATDLNDGAGDDEQLEMNFWYRRDS